MVELLEGMALRRYLLEKYAKEPTGWSFSVFPSKKSTVGPGALIGSKDEVWRVQLDSAYSGNPLTLGARTDLDVDKLPRSSQVSYGYRKINDEIIRSIFQIGESSESVQKFPPESRPVRTLDDVLSSIAPVYPKASDAYAQGPIIMRSRSDLEPLLDRQKDLEDKLALEMNRLMKKRYLAYG